MRIQQWMFGKLREVVTSYGYEEYTGPRIEAFELYAAKTGDEIVNNQLYWFVDRGGRMTCPANLHEPRLISL